MTQKLLSLCSLRALLITTILLLGGGLFSPAWADVTTYIFTAQSWTATSGGSAANWTSGKNGAGFNNNGIQVTTSNNGANGTSPDSFDNVSKIVVTYNTNKSSGAGSIKAQIGSNDETTNTVGYGSGDGRTANYTTEFNYVTPQSGAVKLTVNTTTNSIYLVSVAITYSPAPLASFGYNESTLDVTYGDESITWPTLTNTEGLSVTYSSSNTSVATINASTGVVSLVKPGGSTTITATPAEGEASSYTLTYNKAAADLNYATSSYSTKPSTAIDTPVLTNPHGLTVSFATDDADVADVNASTGALTIGAKEGTATITASSEATDYYLAGVATYTVTVSDWGVGGTYIPVTSASDLVAGNKYIIVNSGGYALSTNQNTNNRGRAFVDIEDGMITLADKSEAALVKLGGESGAWTLNTSGGYLEYATGGNYLKSSATVVGDKQKWVITPAANKTTIQNKNSTSYTIQYNSSNNVFSCYTSSQQPIQLYQRIEIVDAELSFASSTLNATYGSDFSTPVLTNSFDASLNWTSLDEEVATVASDGSITLVAAGTTTITATATGRYTGSASYTLNVARGATSLSFAAASPKTYVGMSTYVQAATVSPAAADITVSYAFVGEHGDATINTSNGTVTFNGYTGDLTIQATAAQTTKWAAPSAQTYTLTVDANPIATLSLSTTSESTTYGTNVVLDGTFATDYLDEEGADVLGTGYNSSIATFSFDKGTGKITITPVSVGATTFTFKAKATGDYQEGSTVNFTITVNAPEVVTNLLTPIFTETFNSTEGSGGRDDQWGGSIATNAVVADNVGWTVGSTGAYHCLKFNKGGNAKTPAINTGGANKLFLSFNVAGWNGESGDVTLSVDNGTLSNTTAAFTSKTWEGHEVQITDITESSIKITFTAPSGKRFFLDDVIVSAPASPTVQASIPASGIGTYCSEYPLTFNVATDATVKAYAVTAYEEGMVTLTKIHGDIVGGTPFIVKATPSTTVDLTPAASGSAYGSTNLLEGTLAPTYLTSVVGDNTNFGMSGGAFKKINTGVIPAHKAYLPLPTEDISNVKAFTLVFVDEETGITETRTVTREQAAQIFDLNGRRLAKPVKGINIINGKKVLVR